MSAFDRFSSALQYQIVNKLGWRGLRDVQNLAAAEILEGRNCVVLAPTAGGKTEASFFPLLSMMDSEAWKPVSVIYVAPIRALLNNQEERLSSYAEMLGRRAFKWHGDVTPGAKKRFVADPADILLTTPESLEVMLMSKKVPAGNLFRHLRAVVIDEIHAFVGDDRGGHLSSVLERLSRFCGSDIQRIGLSATVGNPPDILRWSAGSSKREGRVVDPARALGSAKSSPDIKLDFVGSDGNAAKVIANMHHGEKRLVFVDSRRRVESLGKFLRAEGVNVFVTHSSLSADERLMAERAFSEGKDRVIVATSALELGIDIGDLDRVIQVDAPSTVASFLQRMGRTGRRGDVANCLFLATTDEALVQSAALLALHETSFVEDVPLARRSAHLLAHQIMALSVQEGGIPRSDFWAWVSAATPFQGLDDDDRHELLEHMLGEDILAETAGRLVLGDRGEKLYGRKNFLELYAVFRAPQTLTVMWGAQSIGSIDAVFAESEELGKLSFVLGARAWRAIDINWRERTCRVEPVKGDKLPRWQGSPQLLHRELCQAIRAVLVDEDEPSYWASRAKNRMVDVRAEYGFLDRDNGLDLLSEPLGFRLWTFAGGRANNLLGKTLETILGDKVTLDNLYLGLREEAAKSASAIAEAVRTLVGEERPSEADAVRVAELCSHRRLSKFQPCLTERLEAQFLADELTSPVESRAAIALPLRIHG